MAHPVVGVVFKLIHRQALLLIVGHQVVAHVSLTVELKTAKPFLKLLGYTTNPLLLQIDDPAPATV